MNDESGYEQPQSEQPPDLSPIAYRAIIEGLLRHADLHDINYHHPRLMRRAYEACGIETEECTLYLGYSEYLAIMPVDRGLSGNYSPKATGHDTKASGAGGCG